MHTTYKLNFIMEAVILNYKAFVLRFYEVITGDCNFFFSND